MQLHTFNFNYINEFNCFTHLEIFYKNWRIEYGRNAEYGGNPYGGQPYGGQPYGGQPYGGQPYGGQPYGGQPGVFIPPNAGGMFEIISNNILSILKHNEN